MGKTQEGDLNNKVKMLARACKYEEAHSLQACKLALALFDQLSGVHGFGQEERQLLEAAAILHDIGWIKGQKKHHKTSQEIIIQSDSLLLTRRERLIVGLVARYHRKSLPRDSHEYFSQLDKEAKIVVETLAAFLRLADGLDRSHKSCVTQLLCKVSQDEILINVRSGKQLQEDMATGKEKSDLLERVFGRKVKIIPVGESVLLPQV